MEQSESTFPLADFLSMRTEKLEPGHARAVLEANEVHHNPHGFLHGAVLFTMVDTAMGAATMSLLPEGQRCSTIEVQLRFLRPVVAGALTADTTVIKPGRRVFHLESKVMDGDGRLVAAATGSFAVIDMTTP
jgi:acyl-CoA thioesterase